MKTFRLIASAIWRQAALGWLLTAAVVTAAPPSQSVRSPNALLQIGRPDQAEGAKILQQFRESHLPGDYYLRFELRILPRRGEEQDFPGQLWGGRNPDGPVSRVALGDGDQVRRWLVQNGPHPAIWLWSRASSSDAAAAQTTQDWFAPLLSGSDLTLFDLLMPYRYWTDFTYEGMESVRGRTAYVFHLRPPPALAAQHARLAGVRLFIDTEFRALLQVQTLGADGRPYKTLSVMDLKRVGGQWTVKTIDLRNDLTRDKTRFEVTGAALDQDFSPVVFDPSHLGDALEAPAAARL